MTILIYRLREINGEMKAAEIAQWKDGKIIHQNGKTTEISRHDVIHENNNGYYFTTEIDD